MPRPRAYANDAERQRAYRERKRQRQLTPDDLLELVTLLSKVKGISNGLNNKDRQTASRLQKKLLELNRPAPTTPAPNEPAPEAPEVIEGMFPTF